MKEKQSSKRKGKETFSTKSHKKTKLAKDAVDAEASSSSKKRALKEKRQSGRRHAEVVTEAKEIWNKLRLKTNSPDEIKRLMEELMKLMAGKINELALQHDASRVVQAAVQFGTAEQRRVIVKELCTKGNILELSKVQYAHFAVLKMIKYCYRDNECVRLIVKALKGSIPKLAVHAVGARVVELLFSTFAAKSTASLKQEFYGPHFSLFAEGDTSGNGSSPPSLAKNLQAEPEKEKVTLEFTQSIINKGIEKGLFGFAYLQELFAEYIKFVSSNEVRSIIPSVVDHSIHMLSTRAGTYVVAACSAYGTAKDRKRIMKSLKGYSRSSLLHRDAYLAILRLVQVTDDTVTVQKIVLAELLTNPDDKEKSPLLDLALNENASKLFLMLLVSEEDVLRKYLDPYELEVLSPSPTVVENGKDVPTSKKNPETRRKELVQYIRTPLIEMCTKYTKELVLSLHGGKVIKEVYAAFRPQEVVDAVVAVCANSLSEAKESDQVSLFEDVVGHHTVRNLIQCDATPKDASPLFVQTFFREMKSHFCDIGNSNRGAFVLTALCKSDAVRSEVTKELQKQKAQFLKLSESSKPKAGYEALLSTL